METLKITSARFLKTAKKKKRQKKEKLQGPLIVLVKCAVTSHGCNIRLPLLVHLREDWTPPNNQQRALCRSWERERSTRLRRLTGKCQPRRARRDQYCMHVVVRAGSRPEPGLLPARWIRGETLKGGGKKRVNCLFSRCWNLWEVAGFVVFEIPVRLNMWRQQSTWSSSDQLWVFTEDKDRIMEQLLSGMHSLRGRGSPLISEC